MEENKNYVVEDSLLINGRYYRRIDKYLILDRISQQITSVYLAKEIKDDQRRVVIKCLAKVIEQEDPKIIELFKLEAE
jgi:hypothetical protein